MDYKLVDPKEEAFHNEYFEISFDEQRHKSLYFTSNAEILEDVAAEIVARHAENTPGWRVIPHPKIQH
ncbi:hypothetical protein [Siphonobacter sp.]|uniref:hypothetical protein n=1 Tax=Siphonobacter sp. TaxID=1869184 RepID=UPI003B3A9CD4